MNEQPQSTTLTNQHDVLLSCIRSLTSRFESSEDRLNEDVVKLEQRIDQLVDLVRSIAALQQQVSQQQKTVSEIRVAVKASIDSLTKLVHTSDDRTRESLTLLLKRVNALSDAHDSDVETINTRLDADEARFNGWLNRGLGAWAVFVLVIGAVQYGGDRVIDQIQEERIALQEKNQQLTARIVELERRLVMIETK